MDQDKDRAEKFGGFILAGGQSARMGRDKAMLEIDGVSMIRRAIDLVRSIGIEAVVVGSPGEFRRQVDSRSIGDEWPGAGPLGGIATALRDSDKQWNLVVACDMPYLTKEWLDFLLARARVAGADAVVPMNVRGAEPLCAGDDKRAEGVIRGALEG